MSFNIFVYGTLKTGEPNHYWFEEASTSLTAVELVGPGVTQERLPLITATEFNIPMLLGSNPLRAGTVSKTTTFQTPLVLGYTSRERSTELIRTYLTILVRVTRYFGHMDIECSNLVLDILEAYPTLYNRRLMTVVTEGQTLDCWTYMISDFR